MPSQAAGKVNVVLTVEAATYSATIDKAKAKLNELGGASKEMASHTVSSAAAASGALRGIEGAIPIRAAEKFLSMLPGVGAALTAAFPIIGALAVAEVIARGANELINFTKKTREAGAQFKASFQDMQNSSRLSNDELAKSNVELEKQIAKLTGKHENVLKDQLADARIEADKLAMSAANGAKQVKELLERNKASLLARVMGSDSTNEVFGNVNNFQNNKAEALQRFDDATHNGDATGAAKAKQDYEQQIKNERAYYRDQISLRSGYVKYAEGPNGSEQVRAQKGEYGAGTYASVNGDQSRTLTALRGALGLNYDEADKLDLTKEHNALVAQKDVAENAKTGADLKRKADADHLRALQEELSIRRTQLTEHEGESKGNFSQRQRETEIDFYSTHLHDFKEGTTEYKSVLEGLNTALRGWNETNHEGAEAVRTMLGNNGKLQDQLKGTTSSERDTQSYLAALSEQKSTLAELADKQAEARIADQERNGEITKLDAATQLATIHTQQYADALAKLAQQRKQIERNPDLSPDARRAKLAELDTQGQVLGQQRTYEQGQDADAVTDQTGKGAFSKSLRQYITETQDTAGQVRNIWSSSFTGINEQLSDMLSGQRTSWKGFFSSIAKDLANIFLQKGEAALFSGLLGGAGGGGLLSSVGTLFSGLGFADGGDPPPGVASLVGESGPELFVPKGPGTIVPNHKLGGGTTHNWHIDARGATDPAAVKAMVRQGIAEAAPALLSASQHASREAAARKPASRR